MKELLLGNCTKPPNATCKCAFMTRSWSFSGSGVPPSLQEGLPGNGGQTGSELCPAPSVFVTVSWQLAGPLKLQRQVFLCRLERVSFICKASVSATEQEPGLRGTPGTLSARLPGSHKEQSEPQAQRYWSRPPGAWVIPRPSGQMSQPRPTLLTLTPSQRC